ncbi:MAG: PTS sugar transporter subunit IIC, partial [Anaerostipes sp.]
MTISWLQAIILGIFACLSSMPGMGGTTIGNYTLGRPLVAGLVCGIVLGDIQAGVLVGAAMQVVYIALVTPGGTVSADVRAVSYIGIPLAMLALNSYGLDPASAKGISMATSFGAMVGTIGTVLFYGTATFRNWAYGNLTCFSQEHMQTFGYLCAMLPLVEELYDTKEEQKEAMNTGGSVVGPIFYIVAWNLIMAFGMKFLYF